MKVCLIRPPTITTAEAVGEDAAPPLGVAYLAGALLAAGHDVTIIDALALQLLLLEMSESMGNHDSEVVDASSVD
jgi:hypothetical protein